MIDIAKLDEIIRIADIRYKRHIQEDDFSATILTEERYDKIVSRGIHKDLENFLEELSDEELFSVLAIMYIGDDEESKSRYSSPEENYREMLIELDHLKKVSKFRKIRSISEKMPLYDYLTQAKEILELE